MSELQNIWVLLSGTNEGLILADVMGFFLRDENSYYEFVGILSLCRVFPDVELLLWAKMLTLLVTDMWFRRNACMILDC